MLFVVCSGRSVEGMGQFSTSVGAPGSTTLVPANIPSANAWDKPINLNLAPVVTAQLQLPAVATATAVMAEAGLAGVKYDKGAGGDQTDSGIDISEMAVNSAGSSTRSSPNSNAKAKAAAAAAQFGAKPQRQPSVGKVCFSLYSFIILSDCIAEIFIVFLSLRSRELWVLAKLSPLPTQHPLVTSVKPFVPSQSRLQWIPSSCQ